MKGQQFQSNPHQNYHPSCDDIPQLMNELRVLARRLLRREAPANRLQTTSLVHRALDRQARRGQTWDELTWENRSHFLGSVYRAMQHALIDRGRVRQRRQKAGFMTYTPIGELLAKDVRYLVQEPIPIIEALLTALHQLERLEPKWAEAIHHHFFGGFTLEETAQLMSVDVRTLYNWRQRAYDLLHSEIIQSLELEV